MSITITTDIFCDECHNWAHYCTGQKAEPRKALQAAKRCGWTIGRSKHVCPACNGTDKNYYIDPHFNGTAPRVS